MKEKMKNILYYILITIAILMLITIVMSIPIPVYKTTVDGKVSKVQVFDKYYLVTFDLGNNVQASYKINYINALDGYTGRIVVKLYGDSDTLLTKWNGIYSIGDIVKLDNYGK